MAGYVDSALACLGKATTVWELTYCMHHPELAEHCAPCTTKLTAYVTGWQQGVT